MRILADGYRVRSAMKWFPRPARFGTAGIRSCSHASHAVPPKASAGNIKPDNGTSRKKIDGMAALVNAVAGAIGYPPEPPCVYEKRGVLLL